MSTGHSITSGCRIAHYADYMTENGPTQKASLIDVWRGSVIAQLVRRFATWSEYSVFVRIILDRRMLLVLLGLVLLASSIRILLVDVHASIKFLSFSVLFLLTAIVVWPLTKPTRE